MSRENPFLALRSYTRADAGKFFGRDSDLIILKSRLLAGRSTLLFSASGTGKSSFLNARLRPALEEDWLIVSHSEWAAKSPLEAVRAKTREVLATAQLDPGADDAPIPDMLRRSFAPREQSAPGRARAPQRVLFILDQFEEMFQHWRDLPEIDTFAAEIAHVVELSQVDARLIFSMREEFLGELSLFDQLIPELFGNSYRLKNPSREQSEDIIERTAGKTCAAGLQLLLDDLVGCGPALAGQPNVSSLRNRIALPFLQIACYRIWEAQMKEAPETAEFLSGYQRGRAATELRDYCTETVDRLLKTDEERTLASEAFGFLMTGRRAKVAYELDHLANHMIRDRDELKAVLEKLSDPEVRILREFQGGSSGSEWFELYHDLYASFLFDWKTEVDRQRRIREQQRQAREVAARLEAEARSKRGRARLTNAIVVAILIVTVLGFLTRVFYMDYRNVANWTESESGKYPDAVASTAILSGLPYVGDRVRGMWAAYWKELAEKHARLEDRDAAIVYGLMSAEMKETPGVSRELGAWTGGPLADLVRQARLPDDISLVDVASDGETILAVAGAKVYRWPRGANAKLTETATLRFSPGDAFEKMGARPENAYRAVETIRGLAFSADGKRVLAYGRDRFGLFSADSGQLIWSDPEPGLGPNLRPTAVFSPNGTWVVLGTPVGPRGYSLRVCSAVSEAPNCIAISAKAEGQPVFSPDSSKLAIPQGGPGVAFWDTATREFSTTRATGVSQLEYLAPDRIAFRRFSLSAMQTLEILQSRGGIWEAVKSFPAPNGSFTYSPRRNSLAVNTGHGLDLIDLTGKTLLSSNLRAITSNPCLTADGNVVLAGGRLLSESVLRDRPDFDGIRLSEGEVLLDISPDGSSFVAAGLGGTRLRKLGNSEEPLLLQQTAAADAKFSPSGKRLFTRHANRISVFQSDSWKVERATYEIGPRYNDNSWMNEDTLLLASMTGFQTRALVHADSGSSIFTCQCDDLAFTPNGDLIELGKNWILMHREPGGYRDSVLPLKNSEGIGFISLQGETLVGVHGNQFRVWNLAKPAEEPVVVRSSDRLLFAEAGWLPSHYVTISETGELNLWPVSNPTHYSHSAKVAAASSVLPLGQTTGAAILGNEWFHVLTGRENGGFRMVSRPVYGNIRRASLRSGPNGIRLAVSRPSGTVITPWLKPDLSDVAPFAPPAGKTWTDVLNDWKRRLGLSINEQGRVSSAVN